MIRRKLFSNSLLMVLLIATFAAALHLPRSYAYTGTNVYVDPARVEYFTDTTPVNSTFTVHVKCGNFTDLAGYEYKLYWNRNVLNVTSVTDHIPFTTPFVATNITEYNYNSTHGRFYFVVASLSGSWAGNMTLRDVTFKIISTPPIGNGNYLYSGITIDESIFGDHLAQPIEHVIHNGDFYYTNPGPVAVFTYSPSNPRMTDLVQFNASSSYVAGPGNIVSYYWDFGDGTNHTGVLTTHSFLNNGTFNVVLTVTDNASRTDNASHSVVVTPFLQSPVALFSYSPSLIKVNMTTVTFNASASHDPDGTIASYNWDFGDSHTNVTAAPIITHMYSAIGNYTVSLTVVDNDGLNDTTSTQIRVWPQHIPPVALFTYSPATPQPNGTTTFNATTSYDLDGTIANYTWNFGDSNITTVTTPAITHVYVSESTYTVTLNVTDNEGLSNILQHNITVRLIIPPTANFTYMPTMPSVDYVTTFDASASTAQGTILSYIWNFGDTHTSTTTSPTITHTYTTAGNYTVSLTVVDDNGLNDTMTMQVTVNPAIPWLELQPATRLVMSEEFEVNVTIKHLAEEWRLFGVQLNLNYDSTYLEFASASDGPFLQSFPWSSTPPYTYVFSYSHTGYVTLVVGLLDGSDQPAGYIFPNGEGTVLRVRFRTTSNVLPTVSYPLDFTISDVVFGSYNVTEIPQYASSGASYYIRIDPPVPLFSYKPLEPAIGETMTLNASESYDTTPFGSGTIVSYIWDFGDGASGTGMITTHAYAYPGTYVVTLTVTDNDGNSRSANQTIVLSRAYIDVKAEVGSLYFRSEIAEFYVQTSIWGTSANVESMTATLHYGATQTDLTSMVTHVGTGLYKISYTIPTDASAGTWALVLHARYLSLSGTTLTTFQISSTLTNWNARLIALNDSIATIQTDVGLIRANLTVIHAQLTDISSGVATIQTDVGTIKANLTAINARVVEVNGNVATVETDVGDVTTDVSNLGTDLKSRVPTDTGTLATILYLAVLFSAIAMLLGILMFLKIRKLKT